MKIKLNETYLAVFEYLNDLRSGGAVNMFGSFPYVKREFPELNDKLIQELITLWMKNFKKDAEEYKNLEIEI